MREGTYLENEANVLRLVRICGLALICAGVLIAIIFWSRGNCNPGLICACAVACLGHFVSGLILLFSAKMYARQQELR